MRHRFKLVLVSCTDKTCRMVLLQVIDNLKVTSEGKKGVLSFFLSISIFEMTILTPPVDDRGKNNYSTKGI